MDAFDFYSGKAAYGMLKDMSNNPTKWEGRKVLFVHTGGLLGLYDKVDQLSSLAGSWRRMDLEEFVHAKISPVRCSDSYVIPSAMDWNSRHFICLRAFSLTLVQGNSEYIANVEYNIDTVEEYIGYFSCLKIKFRVFTIVLA